MRVFKFGGASMASADRFRQVAAIIRPEPRPLLVVASALGKTTNALEEVTSLFFEQKREEALSRFGAIVADHRSLIEALGCGEPAQFADLLTEAEWMLHDAPVRSFDYYYDQIVCLGELLSSSLLAHYLAAEGITSNWMDVRDLFRTDNRFRDARIDWTETGRRVSQSVAPELERHGLIITQGFIGATDENESTTLGREGSDYSAAVFAHLLGAESQTIWKDVPGVMNADPKRYPKAEQLFTLPYREVVEMAYYGAQVIHPRTIKPLQNMGIPLLVRSFLHPEGRGTRIDAEPAAALPPIIVFKEAQVLVQFSTPDYSFAGEGLNADIYRLLEEVGLRPNLTQNAAISLMCVLDDQPSKIDALAGAASAFCSVNVQRQLTLLTVRHFREDVLGELVGSGRVLLRQQTEETVQLLITR